MSGGGLRCLVSINIQNANIPPPLKINKNWWPYCKVSQWIRNASTLLQLPTTLVKWKSDMPVDFRPTTSSWPIVPSPTFLILLFIYFIVISHLTPKNSMLYYKIGIGQDISHVQEVNTKVSLGFGFFVLPVSPCLIIGKTPGFHMYSISRER